MEMVKFIYLDASITERFFKKAINYSRRNKPLILPQIFQFFQQHSEIKLFASSFTLAENFEHMWKSYQATSQEITELSEIFIKKFTITPILEFAIKPNILRWVKKYKLEAKDVIHLTISKNHKLFLLTDDENLLKRGKAIYDKIISEEDLPSLLKSSVNTR